MRNSAGNSTDEAESHGLGSTTTTKAISEAELPARELKPNTTQFPNILLDKFLAIVEPSDWKIISHIVRKTYGWHKERDAISATQLSKATGLTDKWCSERCEMLAAAGLLQKGPMAKDSRTGRQLGHMWKTNLNCAPINVLTYLRENSRTAKKRGPLSGPRNSVNPSTESAVSGPQNEPFGGHSVNQQKKLSKENIKRKITLSHEATPNYRRRRFIEHLKIYRERLSGRDTFQPTAKDFRNLDIWLREHPNTTLETFQRCLGYRAQSVAAGEVSAAEEIYRWIGTILEFSEGPLNRYGKPLGQSKEGKYGTGKTEAIASNLNTALERRRTGRMAGEKISNIAECISGAAADCGSK